MTSARRSPASLRQACLRVAALQRHAQARQATSAALLDNFAGRLSGFLARSDERKRQPASAEAVAAAIGMGSAAVILLGDLRLC